MKKFVKIYYKMDENDKIDIRIQLLKMGKSMKNCAEELGVSTVYLSEVLNGKRNISYEMLEQFIKIGIKLNVKIKYNKKKDDIALKNIGNKAEGYGTETDYFEGNGTIIEGARAEGKPTGYYDIEGRGNILKGWV